MIAREKIVNSPPSITVIGTENMLLVRTKYN